MSNLEAFTAGNEQFAGKFASGHLPMPPARHTAVVACMDARLHPEAALGLALGDSHMIRNAGGRVSDDALRSLAISQQLLGTNEIYVIHHTDCGMLTFKNPDIISIIQKNLGHDASAIDFLPFSDVEQSVIDDVAIIQKSPLIKPGTPIVGFVYDVTTGKLKSVATAETPSV